MDYKLICIDMDGTLLNEKHEVSDFNKEMIKKATELGVKIAITTGRIFSNARMYSEIIGIKTPIIASNGAYIREPDREEVIYESTLTKNQIKKIIQVVRKYDFLVYMNTFDTVISEKSVDDNHAYKLLNNEIDEKFRIKFDEKLKFDEAYLKYGDKILKSIFINEGKNHEKLMEAKKELSKFEDLEVVSSWANNFEVMAKGTTKGNAVEKLTKILKIKKEEVICIGDSENDLSMIEFAGLGVAMGNADDMIKEKADYITDTNINSGVGKVIKKFILKK